MAPTPSIDRPVPAGLRSDAAALATVAALLAPCGPGGGPRRRYAVLPRATQPRYILPGGRAHAAAVHIRPTGSRRDLAVRVVRPALALGASRLLQGVSVDDGVDGDPSLRRHLASVLRRPEIDLALALGRPRPNRKPVVQLVDDDGTTVAWAKIGVDELTDSLVAHEIDAIRAHDHVPPLVTPRLLADGSWKGHRYLVLADIGVIESAGDLDLTADAVRAIAGPPCEAPLAGSGWWTTLQERAARSDGAPLRRLLDHLAPLLARRRWVFGRWHGDLAPWNAAWGPSGLACWDWERSTGPVPLGIDLAHNRIQVAVLSGRESLGDGFDRFLTRDRAVLEALGYTDDEAALLGGAYLATLRARYLDDALLGPLGPGLAVAAAIDADPSIGGRIR